MLLAGTAATFALLPSFFFAAGDALGASRSLTALLSFISAAIGEEAAKACGIAIASPGRSRFTWFWLTAATAGTMGALERLGLAMNRAPNNALSPTAEFFFDARGVAGHVALSLICMMLTKISGGGVKGWTLGILGAGALHAFFNLAPKYLPMEIRNYHPFVAPVVSGGVFIAIIVFAFVYRHRLDWRLLAPRA